MKSVMKSTSRHLGHMIVLAAIMLLCSVTTTVTGAILNVCISSTALAPNIQTLSDCLNYTGAQVIASAAAISSATTSSNLRALQFNTTQSKVLTYTLTNWAQAVLLAFVRSQSTRTRMYVQLTTASVANNQISIVNTTTGSWWVLDYGAAMMTDGTSTGQTDQIQISGYLSTVAQTQSMMFGSTSLIKSPAYGEMSTVVNAQAQQAALAFVTYPSSGSYAFFGAVYPVPQTSLTASQIVSITSEALQNRPSQNQKNNLHFQMLAGIAANGSLVNFSFYRTTYTDLAISDTPVPTTLAGGVTQAPITDSVIGWYIYLVIGIGVVAAIGFFIFLAKKARLKKEDKKKTAKRRKKEEDKFNKMASDLRSGIKHDDEEDHRELESGGEDKNYY